MLIQNERSEVMNTVIRRSKKRCDFIAPQKTRSGAEKVFGRSVPEPAFKSYLQKNVVVDGKRGFCYEEIAGRLLVLFGGYFAWVNPFDEEVRHG